MKLIPTEPDVLTLVQRIDRGDIDLQPDFQRQEVWATKKKKRLIDTVLRQWSIPPVHLVEVAGNRTEVLDGQQRLASLRDFYHNRFSIDGRTTPHDDFVMSLHGKFYRNLDESARRLVDQYALRCFRITDYRPEEPSELFYRLNQPTMLTAGEQRNALFGPTREQLKELVETFEGLENNQRTLGFSNLRLAYDDVLARVLFFLEARNFGVKSTEARISERFRVGEPFAPEVMGRAEMAVRFFSELRSTAQPYRFNKASVMSWLLFLSRFDGSNPPNREYVQIFIDIVDQKVPHPFAVYAVDVFEDRASLRVTDVSSVIFRDVVLNYVYRQTNSGVLPESVPVQVLEQIDGHLSEDPGASFEDALEICVDINEWGLTL